MPTAVWVLFFVELRRSEVLFAVLAIACIPPMIYQWRTYCRSARGMRFFFLSLKQRPDRPWRYALKQTLLAASLLFFGLAAFAQQVIRVPHGHRPVMIDGKLTPGEWDDAAQFSLGDRARLYVKQSGRYAWIAVECLTGDNFNVDLYVQPADGSLYDLHSSAKIGERKLQGTSWSDQWTWWNNDRWVANWSRVESFEHRIFLSQKVREFQISRARFTGETWRVMFELMLPAEPKWTTFTFPDGAKNTSTEHWIILQFG